MRSNRNCTVLPRNPRDFYEHQVPPSVQVAVLALHALIPTKMEHRYGDLGGESQFVSICFLGPEVLGGGIEVGRGLVLGSGCPVPWKLQFLHPHHLKKELTAHPYPVSP